MPALNTTRLKHGTPSLLLRYWLRCIMLLLAFPLAAKSTEVSYCVDPNWMPYEAIEDGVHVGISADYISLLAQKSDISFRLIPTRSWLQTLQLLQNGTCMLAPMLNYSAEREQFLRFSDVYFRSPNVLISKHSQPFLLTLDNLAKQRLAVPAGYRFMDYLADNYPDIITVLVGSETAALQALLNDSTDVAIGSLYAINYIMQREALSQLKITGWVGLEDKLRVGVALPYVAMLPQLNQALGAITEAEHLAIYRKWTQAGVSPGANYLWWWLTAGVATVIVLVLISLRWRSVQKRRRSQHTGNNGPAAG